MTITIATSAMPTISPIVKPEKKKTYINQTHLSREGAIIYV